MNQGDLHWVDLNEPIGSDPAKRRPCVIVQNDFFNRTSLRTVIVCTLTENVRLASAPGNVLLNPGESGLRGQSVIIVSQITAVDKGYLGEYIGTLRDERIQEVISGIRLLLEPRVY